MVKTFLMQALAAAVAVLVGAQIIPGVRIRRTGTAIGVAVVFALLNIFVGWLVKAVLVVALLPAAIVTLGLPYLVFGLIMNTVMLWLTDMLVDDFEIRGFGSLLGTAGLISLATWLLPRFF